MLSCLFLAALSSPLGRGWPLGSLVCGVSFVLVAFLCGVPGWVWCLVISIPDLCLLYFE